MVATTRLDIITTAIRLGGRSPVVASLRGVPGDCSVQALESPEPAPSRVPIAAAELHLDVPPGAASAAVDTHQVGGGGNGPHRISPLLCLARARRRLVLRARRRHPGAAAASTRLAASDADMALGRCGDMALGRRGHVALGRRGGARGGRR